ncbi:ABC transporter substrate-binding protein [Paenibacillus jilunlii]|uniref:Carbohydrate ABC transporter substrate-binding protein, CUT1 family n=1 Tax=Paenibacillus jilunlii TaxID=682956 RepID=A0A1G9GXG9_9BACL|nr:extracellular solute-binding protein [Paenibacillus jilunlii]KWX73948.1 hypothetical protein AML91_17015 [Paenibacillus jilunlii]SDL05285.1 carbohydrate ABC transporter substrate-binding protein, CUT1 family [Paenibacillus jilunlii]
MKHASTRNFAMILAFVMLVTLVGCAGKGNEEVQKSDKQITLNFMWWGKPSRKEITLKVIELFEKENPNIKINTEDYPSTGEVAQKLAMDTAEQKTPDLMQMDYNFAFNYVTHDLIEPLGPYVKSNILDLSDVDKSYLVSGQYEGKQYGIPMGSNALGMAYDPAMFEQYGIQPLQDPYTVQDLQQTMQQFKDKVQTPGFYPLNAMFDLSYWFRMKGESFYNKEKTGLGYTDATMIEYLTLIKTWLDQGLLNPGTAVAADEKNPLAAGKTAFLQSVSNQMVSMGDEAGRTLKIMNLPTVEGAAAEGNFIKPSMFIMVSSYSEHKEAAVKFVSFLTNDKEANDILKGERGVPIAAKVAEQLSNEAAEQGKEQYSFMNYIAKHSTPIDPPAPLSDAVIQNSLKLILKNLYGGSITPEAAARSFRAQAEEVLEGKGKGSK